MIYEGLSFDDVNLVPQFTDMSRKEVSLRSRLSLLDFEHPFISSNMDTITGTKMAAAMYFTGGLGILHRFSSIKENVEMFENVGAVRINRIDNTKTHLVGVSIGVKDEEVERAAALYEVGARIFCIDIAHGHCKQMGRMLKRLRQDFHGSILIAGNVATHIGAEYLVGCGADAVKVGIGPGGACSTRMKTGCGVPQLTAIMEASKVNAVIIADGGIKTPGDAVKALAAGAHFVMLGSFFAGCDETPGEVYYPEGPGPQQPLKTFRGMASREAQEDFMGKMDDWKTAEGVSIEVPCAGPVKDKVADLCGGLRSGMTYCGATSIDELHRKAEFIRISHAGYMEGTPHASHRLV